MKTIIAYLVLALAISTAEGGGRQRHSHSVGKHRTYTSHHRTPRYSTSAPRDNHSRIKRSSKAKHDFMKQTGYPHGRPGYVIDHKTPLSRGGADSPSNMQWQTKEEAKAKDKWERGPAKSKSRKHR